MSNNQTIPQIKSLTQVEANSNQNPAGEARQWRAGEEIGTGHRAGEEGEMGMATEQAREWLTGEVMASRGDGFVLRGGENGEQPSSAVEVEQGNNMKAEGLEKEMGFYMGGKGSKYENLVGV